jgi:T5SS/PEP-CTERM-associated repeat protein
VNTYTTPNRTLAIIQDYSGNAYFNNYGNTIYKLNTKTGNYTTFATIPTGNAYGMAFDANLNIYVASESGNSVYFVNSSTRVSSLFVSGLSLPTGIAVDNSGNVWISDSIGYIKAYTSGGTLITNIDTRAYAPGPAGISFTPTGNLVIANRGGGADIAQITTNGTLVWTGTYSGGFGNNLGVAASSTGYSYLTPNQGNVVYIFDTNGNNVSNFTGNTGSMVFDSFALALTPGDLYVGSNSTVSPTNITSGSQYFGNTFVGYDSAASNNLLTISNTGTLLVNTVNAYIGYAGSGNQTVISAGAEMDNVNGYIGYTNGSSNNAVLVTGTDGSGLASTWVNNGDLYVGNLGTTNSLVISNGGLVSVAGQNYGTLIGFGSNSSNNSITVTGTNSDGTRSMLSNAMNLYVGYAGSGNTLTVSAGAQVVNSNGYIGYTNGSSSNSVTVNGGTWSNSAQLYVGYSGSGSLTIGSGTVSDSNGYIGYSSGSIGSVTMNGGLWSNSANLYVGNSGSVSLRIGSGTVSDTIGYIGYTTGSTSSVTMTGGLWSNSGSIYIGNLGTSRGTLTVAGSGSVTASSVTIAARPASGGTLNFGSFGGSDTAGTITAPTIAFGYGTGTINFNQINSTTLSSRISGQGKIQQLGTGTTILSGSNSYTGTTLISAGTLQAGSTNAFGTSAVTLTNTGTLALSTNLTISSLIWSGGSSSVAISNVTNGVYLNITGALTLTGIGNFDLSGNTLTTNAVQLMAWGTSNSYTTADFSVAGLSSYLLTISNNALWVAGIPITDLYVGSNSTVPSTNFTSATHTYANTYVGYDAAASNNLLTIGNTNTVLTNSADLWVGYDGSSNSMVISNGGVVANSNGYIGYTNGSTNNSVLVTGTSSLWSNSASLYVGYDSTGNNLTITNSGRVISSNVIIGNGASSSNNSILVAGTNNGYPSLSILEGGLYVGYDGSGNSLTITNGGYVATSSGFTLSDGYLGYHAGSSNNSVDVSGGLLAILNGTLYVGYAGSGNSLTVRDNSEVDGPLSVGFTNGANSNSVIVTGGSLFSTGNGSSLSIGDAGAFNSMTISGGAKVDSMFSVIGNQVTGSNNWVLVTGSNSVWSNAFSLTVGNDGSSNSLTIADGAHVTNDISDLYGFGFYGVVVGVSATASNNSVLVTGSNSVWTITNITNSALASLIVGGNGSGNRLTIDDGATVNVTPSTNFLGTPISLWVGVDQGSNNSVLVSGSNSTLNAPGSIIVGAILGTSNEGNTLVITNGGRVNTDVLLVSVGNSVNLFGAGSLLTASNDLYIDGSMSVGDGSTLTASDIQIDGGYLMIGGQLTNTGGGLPVLPGLSSTINARTIQLINGGTLGFSQTDTQMLTNSISDDGTGNLNQLGTGTTILSGNNTYTGTTLIRAGTLQAGSTNALGTSAVTLTNTGTLALSTNLTISSLIWSGGSSSVAISNLTNGAYLNIAGALSLTGSGTGTFNLSGNTLGTNAVQLMAWGTSNSYTTNNFFVSGVANYSLNISNNNSLWLTPINELIAQSSDTIVSNSATYPAVTFQTNGILTVTTGATLTITSPVDATNNGTVVVNGVLSTPSLIIPIGGTLNGTGTLTGGNLTVNGTMAPGNSPGTFFVSGGNLVMGSTAVWDEQIYSTSVYDRVVVTGSAFLNGTMNITTFGSGGLQFGQKYNFLTASGGISGAFSSIIAPEGFRGRLLLSGTQANILIAPASYTQLAQNRNQSNVATALNSFIPYTSGDQLVVSTSLDSLSASEYNQAFNAIMPTFYQQIATIAFNEANALNMELNQRLWGLRVAEGGGFSMNGLADNFPILEGQGDGEKSVLDSKKDILRPGLDNHWGMFVDGNGIFAQANSGNMLPGYNSESGGITTGLTYKWNDNFASGIYCGYQGTYTKSGANGTGLGTGSSLIDNAVRFGVFGTYGNKDGKGLYANALAGGAYHNFQATRVIQYTGMNRTANSSPGAGELDTMLATGYDIQKGKFTFGPTASLQYTYLGVNSLNETGAQSLDFNSGGWNSSSMLSSVGAHAAYSWVANKNVVVVPQISLNWQHEFMQNPYAISGNLGGTSPTFSNWSTAPIRDFLYTGVGFTVEFAKKWNTSFFYNAAAGNSDLVSQNIFWSVGVKF